jgi:hypothetical protein
MYNTKKTLWIVSELFYPEAAATAYIITKIANEFSKKYNVKVICGTPVYFTETKNNKDYFVNSEIEVYHTSEKKIDKNNKFQRLKRAVFLSKQLCRIVKKNAKAGDKVLAVTNPIFLIVDLSRTCKKLKLKLTMLINDVFPDNSVSAKLLKRSNLLYKLLQFIFKRAYNRVDTLIACGTDMESVIRNKISNKTNNNSTTNVLTIHNWANLDLQPLERERNGKIIIKFAGNLGRVQGIDVILKVIEEVHNPMLKFVFQGSGAMQNCINKFIALQKNNYNNIELLPSYRREEEQFVLNSMDIGLVTLADGMYGLGVPSKSYNIMASGKPILFVGPKNSDIYNMVNENDIGWAFDIKQTSDLLFFLNNLNSDNFFDIKNKGEKARIVAENEYSELAILKQYVEVV